MNSSVQKSRRCKIVALTAYTNKDSIDKCYKIGMKEVLNKPANGSKIKEVIMKYLVLQNKGQKSSINL